MPQVNNDLEWSKPNIHRLYCHLVSEKNNVMLLACRDSSQMKTSTAHQLSRTHHAFKPSRYHKISSIGLASMQKIIQLYFLILSQTECGCAWCNHDHIATATDWFCESRHKKVWLRFVAEVLRWASSVGRKQEKYERLPLSDQTFIIERTFTFFRL